MILRELIRRRRGAGAALEPHEVDQLCRRIRESGVADRRIGLVLSGGGGKGAYQIGCWQALRELGLDRFTSIAGTSVGALNAALIAQGDFEKARSVWFGIRPSHVLRFNLLTSLKSFLLRVPLIPYYSLKYTQRLRGRLTPSLWEAYYYYRNEQQKHGIWGYALYRAVFKHLFTERRWWSDSLTWMLTAWLLFAAAGTGYVGWDFSQTPGQGFSQASDQMLAERARQLFFFLLAIPSLLCLFLIFWGWLLRRDKKLAEKFPLVSNQPLADLLKKNFDASSIRADSPPVFVTLATLRRIQPDRPGSGVDAEKSGGGEHAVPSTPAVDGAAGAREDAQAQSELPTGFRRKLTGWLKEHLSARNDFAVVDKDYGTDMSTEPASQLLPQEPARVDYVPYYFRLQDFTDEQVRHLVLQSAALPEIFASKAFSGDDYVDGGIADNTPLLPVLEFSSPELVIVIFLNSQQPAGDIFQTVSDLKARIRQAERLEPGTEGEPPPLPGGSQKLPGLGISLITGKPFALPARFGTSSGSVKPLTIEDTNKGGTTFVLPIVPSRGLGGFMMGTLNFFSGKARALMQLGYTDTIRAFQEYDISEL